MEKERGPLRRLYHGASFIPAGYRWLHRKSSCIWRFTVLRHLTDLTHRSCLTFLVLFPVAIGKSSSVDDGLFFAMEPELFEDQPRTYES